MLTFVCWYVWGGKHSFIFLSSSCSSSYWEYVLRMIKQWPLGCIEMQAKRLQCAYQCVCFIFLLQLCFLNRTRFHVFLVSSFETFFGSSISNCWGLLTCPYVCMCVILCYFHIFIRCRQFFIRALPGCWYNDGSSTFWPSSAS